MLTCHPEVLIPPESAFIIWWLDKYSHWTENFSESDAKSFVDDLFSSKKFEFWEMSHSELLSTISSHRPKNYSELITLVYQAYSDKAGRTYLKYWGDKNNYYVGFVDEIYKLFPAAKFIQIVRDARDVATSYLSLQSEKGRSKYSPDLPSDLKSIATEWTRNNSRIHDSFAKSILRKLMLSGMRIW